MLINDAINISAIIQISICFKQSSIIKMARIKFNINDHIPPRDENKECDRCDNIGSRDFVGEWLCNQCIHEDVFEDWNEREN